MNTPTFDGSDARSAHESWLEHIVDQLDGEAGLLSTWHPNGQKSIDGVGHLQSCVDCYSDHFAALDPLPALLTQRPGHKALAVEIKRHPSYKAQTEFHNDFLKKHDIAHIAGFAWTNVDGAKHVIQVHRFIGTLPFLGRDARELERQIHHWRTNEVGASIEPLSTENARDRRRSDIAAQLSTPLAVVDSSMKVIWANPAARLAKDAAWESLLTQSGKEKRNDIRPVLCKLIRACLSQHCSLEAVVSDNKEKHFAIAIPLEGQPGLSLLQISKMNRETPGIKARLQRLLKLSPAESELAIHLAAGESLASIAKIRNVSPGTVRTQLQVIYRKTETHRQSELVSLVQGLCP